MNELMNSCKDCPFSLVSFLGTFLIILVKPSWDAASVNSNQVYFFKKIEGIIRCNRSLKGKIIQLILKKENITKNVFLIVNFLLAK